MTNFKQEYEKSLSDHENSTAVTKDPIHVKDEVDAKGPEESSKTNAVDSPGSTLSKNQQKKLKRKQQWEEGRDERKAKRREKLKAKKLRKRDELEERKDAADASNDLSNAAGALAAPRYEKAVQLPVTFVIDCQFDDLMFEKERISLGSQITRSYSDNKKSRIRAHVVVSSFSGRLKERFEGILARQFESWSGVRFRETDFIEVAKEAKAWMRDSKGGKIAGALLHSQQEHAPDGTAEAEAEDGEIVYLTSDSPNTLHELKPFSTYIIGGLVDKNRHKGVCYKRALDRGLKTAKLPISDFMNMQTRSVLATNHVVEIMLNWLVSGDWADAFTKVMPKRKGGTVKDSLNNDTNDRAKSVIESSGSENGDEGGSNEDQVVGFKAEVHIDPSGDNPIMDT